MSSQVRAGRFKGVENRGVADMPRSGESLRFVDQQKSPPQPLPPPPIFLTKNGTGGWNRSFTKNTKYGTEQDDRS